MPLPGKGDVAKIAREYSMYIALVLIMLFFTYTTSGTFLSSRNLTNLMLQTSYIAVLAIGVVLIIIAGHTDLSLGSLTGLLGGVMAILQVKYGWSTPTTILAGCAAGLLIGAWHGFWIATQGIPAFIVTLTGMFTFRGLLITLTQGETIAPMHDSFKLIGQGYLPKQLPFLPYLNTTMAVGVIAVCAFAAYRIRSRRLQKRHGFPTGAPLPFAIATALTGAVILAAFYLISRYRGLPYSALLLIVLTLILYYVSTRTPFGRYVYAIGGNAEAAKLSGINIRKVNFSLYLIMGLLCAVSGTLFTARLNSATASAGTMFEFDAITSAIIGGASVMGGEGSVVGAVIGALVMGSLNNGMGLMNIPTDRQQIIKGVILLLVVWFDVRMRKKRG